MAKVRGLNKLVDNNKTSFLPASINAETWNSTPCFLFYFASPLATRIMFSATIFPVSSEGYPVLGLLKGTFPGVNGKGTFTAIPAAHILE